VYICFALLVDYNVHNYARKIVYKLNEGYDIGITASLLPQHISLKQTFKVNDIEKVEDYFDELSKEIRPFHIDFSKIDLVFIPGENDKTGILWMDVMENEHLRRLHNKINNDLNYRLNVPISGFDGDGYHFHSTIAFGGKSSKIYEELFKSFDKNINLSFTAKEIALFYSLDSEGKAGTYITYKILPVGR
jgi:2'-5' RNA ligase